MPLPLMPKATAVWLVDNTTLTFDQIAEFCGMHALEIQAIADGDVATGITGQDPVATGQLSPAEIARCEKDASARLRLLASDNPLPQARPKGTRYTPVSKRHDRPDGIAWILKNHPEISDAQICKLLGTTKPTIQSIRDRTHWNAANIKPRNPVTLGLCTEADLEKAIVLSPSRRNGLAPPRPPAHLIEPPSPIDDGPAAYDDEPEPMAPPRRGAPPPDADRPFWRSDWTPSVVPGSEDDEASGQAAPLRDPFAPRPTMAPPPAPDEAQPDGAPPADDEVLAEPDETQTDGAPPADDEVLAEPDKALTDGAPPADDEVPSATDNTPDTDPIR